MKNQDTGLHANCIKSYGIKYDVVPDQGMIAQIKSVARNQGTQIVPDVQQIRHFMIYAYRHFWRR